AAEIGPAVVREEEVPIELVQMLAPIDDATGDGAGACVAVGDLVHGHHEALLVTAAALEAMEPLPHRPTEVVTRLQRCDRDLLVLVLSHVSDVDQPLVYPEPPRVAETHGVETGCRVAVDVQFDQTAEQRVRVLPVA